MNKLFLATSISLSIMLVSCGDKPSEEVAETVTSETPKDTTPVTVNEETKFKFDSSYFCMKGKGQQYFFFQLNSTFRFFTFLTAPKASA